MNRIAVLGTFGGLLVAAVAVFFWNGSSADTDVGVMPLDVDIVEGEQLYAQSCAACHGANLEGQPDWQIAGDDGRLPPPPHDETGHTWHHGDQVLFEYTKLGGTALMAAQGLDFNSGMPGFGGVLTDEEIWNILAYIKSTWPERVQEVQAVRTEGETRKREN